MDTSSSRSGICHNCRRQRLKCDRSLPQCLKCIRRGQECLGYQRLFRWEPGVASRGKMAGKTFQQIDCDKAKPESISVQPCPSNKVATRPRPSEDAQSVMCRPLADPLVADLSLVSRRYILYFASDVCQDFVLYDTPQHNPFRDLLLMTPQQPILLQIVVAISALRMSNVGHRSAMPDPTISMFQSHPASPGSQISRTSKTGQSDTYKDALFAKQKALGLLNHALETTVSVDTDVTLAVVLLFIAFELIDSGRDNWKYHINGARAIIERLVGSSNLSDYAAMSPLRKCLISNCLVFDVIGSTLESSVRLDDDSTFSDGAQALLHDAEGNHCSSFPAALLRLIRAGARLFRPRSTAAVSATHSQRDNQIKQAALLLEAARSFDAASWASSIQARSPVSDLGDRCHVASAHQAAVCVYLSRVLLALDPTSRAPSAIDLEALVTKIIGHLALIRPANPLFSATTWPAFIAGAETRDVATQVWVANHFRELWVVEPWGLIKGALDILEQLWKRRGKEDADEDSAGKLTLGGGWLTTLRDDETNWLIL